MTSVAAAFTDLIGEQHWGLPDFKWTA